MLMKYVFENCVLVTDADENRKLYEKLPFVTDECSCDGCTNYMLASDCFPREVTGFFEDLGIDIRKACEVIAWGSENGGKAMQYGGFYHLAGKLERNSPENNNNPEPVSFHRLAEGYYIWFTEEISLAEDCLGEEAVQMEIEFHGVPWLLDKENTI